MAFMSKRFINFGLPMILFIVGGSFALQLFTDIRYKVSSHKQQLGMTDDVKRMFDDKTKNKPKKTLEEEYLEMRQNVDINSWENKRGPRPWEK